jgi:ABC-type polysaccharide/polyol phosphate export permease
VMYRDLYYMVTSLITVGFWATPVLYSTQMAPGWLRPFLRLNPVGGLIEGARQIIMQGQWPAAEYLVPALIVAVVVFVVGCAVFRKQNLQIADYV